MSLLRSLVLDLDLDLGLDLELELDLDLELFWSMSAIWILPLHKTDEAVTAKIANNPALAKALTDPNLTPTQKQQLAKELVSSVMFELGYTQAVDVKLVPEHKSSPLLLSIFA
jgi:hypothetical protein